MVTAPHPSLLQAARTANRVRFEALLDVTLAKATPLDVILRAAQPEHMSLRNISLKQLLLAQPKVGDRTASRFLSVMNDLLPADVDASKQNVGWLIDPRSGGKRLYAWLDVDKEKTVPWPGFPFAPEPEVVV